MDATTISVLGALGVALISSITAVVVAFINNRKERTGSADAGMVLLLKERIEFGEDRLEAAGLELARRNEIIDELRRALAKCTCQGEVT